MSTWPHFTLDELRCRHCGQAAMDAAFMTRLEQLRVAYRQPIVLSSAYRCAEHNARVSSTGADGPHTHGHAVDIRVQGADALRLVKLALTLGFTGIGVQQKGTGRFVHLDDLPAAAHRPRPWLWSY